jgi:hypothetical protein
MPLNGLLPVGALKIGEVGADGAAEGLGVDAFELVGERLFAEMRAAEGERPGFFGAGDADTLPPSFRGDVGACGGLADGALGRELFTPEIWEAAGEGPGCLGCIGVDALPLAPFSGPAKGRAVPR